MVYLVRTSEAIGNYERGWKLALELRDYLKENYSLIKTSKFFTKISGDQSEYTWILGFESMADEEKTAIEMMKDEKYFAIMGEAEGCFSSPYDDFYREIP